MPETCNARVTESSVPSDSSNFATETLAGALVEGSALGVPCPNEKFTNSTIIDSARVTVGSSRPARRAKDAKDFVCIAGRKFVKGWIGMMGCEKQP